jgi:hypothetical protein
VGSGAGTAAKSKVDLLGLSLLHCVALLYSTTGLNPVLLFFENRAPRGSQKIACPKPRAAISTQPYGDYWFVKQ